MFHLCHILSGSTHTVSIHTNVDQQSATHVGYKKYTLTASGNFLWVVNGQCNGG